MLNYYGIVGGYMRDILEYVRSERKIKILLGIYMITMSIYMFLRCRTGFYYGYVEYCLSDMYISASRSIPHVQMPIFMFICTCIIKDEYRAAVLLNLDSIKNFWNRLFKKILVFAAFLTIYDYIMVTVIGLQYAQFECNWNLPGCYACQSLGAVPWVITDTRIIMLLYVILDLIMLLTTGMIIIISWWIFNGPIVGVMLIIVDIAEELCMSPPAFEIYYAKMIMSEYQIYHGVTFQDNLMYPLLVCIGMYLVGLAVYTFWRKDWLGS